MLKTNFKCKKSKFLNLKNYKIILTQHTYGMWRSLVAHTHGVRGVAGSNPVIPTFLCNPNNNGS